MILTDKIAVKVIEYKTNRPKAIIVIMPDEPKSISIKRNPRITPVKLSLPSSKSESNRALIIKYLSKNKGNIYNLSSARDTVTLKKLLESKEHTLDVIDAGTTMRFLTAYLAVTGQDRILTGTPRMCDRPIGILVDALRQLGADISYIEKEGYPPLLIRGFSHSGINQIKLRGDISSQYISALLMIGPVLKNGLTVELTGKTGSVPYIRMTLNIMQKYGVKSTWNKNRIHIAPQRYKDTDFEVSPDWSGASYWYGMVALAKEAELQLKGFTKTSLQGDSIIMDIMDHLGVKTDLYSEGILLRKKPHKKQFSFDFSNYPDLAQTVAVVCAAKGLKAVFSGLESLRIKETDRIGALQKELRKTGADLLETAPAKWKIEPLTTLPRYLHIDTYNDHRMAMALAPLATLTNLKISCPSVVIKSYPTFWDDLKQAGFEIQYE